MLQKRVSTLVCNRVWGASVCGYPKAYYFHRCITTQAHTSQDKHTIRDSLEFPSISLPTLPKLTSFQAAKDHFANGVLNGNKEETKVWVAPPQVVASFRDIFPELVESRGITKLPEDAFQRWDHPGANDIEVELDDDTVEAVEHINFLAAGGPAPLASSLLYQLRKGKNSSEKIVYAVTSRQDSNHDGSAYYFHERDAFPVYINRVNRGPYCVYIDLKKRLTESAQLLKSAIEDRHHVKISLNWENLRINHLFGIFIPNFYHMMGDVYLRDPKNSLMKHTVEHAKKTHEIVDAISKHTGMKRTSMLFQGHDKACYVGFEGGVKPEEHFKWLNKYTEIPFNVIDHTKAFGPDVNQVVSFPRDGLMSPWVIDNLKAQITEKGGEVRENILVQKILVKRDGDDVKVTKVLWKDQKTNKQKVVSVDKFVFSFGPSCSVTIKPPSYSVLSHVKDVLSNENQSTYAPTISSLVRHVANNIKSAFFRGRKLFKSQMYAAGSSSVIMVGVDLAKASEPQLELFTKFMDGVNQHWTLIASRDAKIADSGKTYRFFAIQMTGGGNFPSRNVRPDYLVNLLHTTEKMMGLSQHDYIVYDSIQTRSCGRGVSGKNSVAFSPLATNCIAAYALGGIGMTTMFPNAELLLQLLEHKQGVGQSDLKNGVVGSTQKVEALYNTQVLQGVDYTTIVDADKKVARLMGWYEPSAAHARAGAWAIGR